MRKRQLYKRRNKIRQWDIQSVEMKRIYFHSIIAPISVDHLLFQMGYGIKRKLRNIARPALLLPVFNDSLVNFATPEHIRPLIEYVSQDRATAATDVKHHNVSRPE